MNYLLAFIVLDLINPWGLDSFVIPKTFALSLLIVWYESFKENNWHEVSFMMFFSAIILVCSLDWTTSILGCELMGFGGLVQIFIYYEVYKVSRDAKNATGDAILLFMVPMLAYAVIQRLGFDYSHSNWKIPENRALSFQGNPVFLSMTIGMLFPLCLSKFKQGWAYVSLTALSLLGLLAANSKSGWMAAGIGTICLYLG